MTEVIITVCGVLTAAGTGFFGWIFGRRQTNANARKTEIEGTEKILEIYKKHFDEFERQFKEMETFRKKVDEYKEAAFKAEIESKSRETRYFNEVHELKEFIKKYGCGRDVCNERIDIIP